MAEVWLAHKLEANTLAESDGICGLFCRVTAGIALS